MEELYEMNFGEKNQFYNVFKEDYTKLNGKFIIIYVPFRDMNDNKKNYKIITKGEILGKVDNYIFIEDGENFEVINKISFKSFRDYKNKYKEYDESLIFMNTDSLYYLICDDYSYVLK